MLQVKVIVAIVLIFILTFIILFSALTFMTKRKNVPASVKYVRYFKKYHFYYDFVLTRKSFRKVYAQIIDLAVYNYMDARVQAVKFYERSMLIAVAIFVVSAIGFGDILTSLLLFLFSIVLMNNTIFKRIDDVNYQCLKAVSRLTSSLMSNYTRLRDIPEAIKQCQCPPILKKTVDQLYLIVTANDGRERLDRFFIENQNRNLRTIAVTCFIRLDAGDDAEHESPFTGALRLIKDEVDAECLRQLKMRLMFKKLEYLPLTALFLYPPFSLMITKILSATEGVFSSTLGYVGKLVLVITVLVSYYILSSMNNSSVARTDDRLGFITSLMHRRRVRHFATSLLPKSFRKRMKQQKIIDGCLSSKTIEYIALEKFVFGVIGIIVTFFICVSVIISSRAATYNTLADTTMSTSIKYTAEQKIAVLDIQHKMMDGEINPSMAELEKFFSSTFPKVTNMEMDSHISRLTDVVAKYKNITFRWWFVAFMIAAWFLGHYVSDYLLRLRSKLVESEAELDVLQLQTVIAILMDTTLDTLGVLYWLARSSDVHRNILTYCYHEYTIDAFVAIDRLKVKSTIPEFEDMCDKLKTTIVNITLKEAFTDLVADRQNTMATREEVQMQALRSKRSMASPIAKVSMTVWMIVTFIIPVVVITINTAKSTLSGLGNLGG